MNADRLRQGLAEFVDSRVPGLLYAGSYPGKVVQQRGPNAFDFEPDDQRLPDMAGIPIKLSHPGVSFQIDAGAGVRAELRFAGADPRLPELHFWEEPGLQKWTLDASQEINLGSGASHPLVLGDNLSQATSSLATAWAQFQTSTTTLASAMTSYAQGIQANADPGPGAATKQFTGAVATFETAIAQMTTAIEQYLASVQTALSQLSKTV